MLPEGEGDQVSAYKAFDKRMNQYYGGSCPPIGWKECSSDWPPKADGYCCGADGRLSDFPDNCKSGINALNFCCKLI